MHVGIRKYKESDADESQEAVLESVDHLSKWLSWCNSDYRIEDARQWASSAKRTWENGTDYRFVVEDQNTGGILGSVGINQVVDQHKVGNLGYWIRKSAINNGVCTRAARQVVEFAFRELGFQRIEIHALCENEPSNIVASNIGGVFEGVFRNKLIFEGKSMPANCYSVIPSDYGI